jgi:hypothetical protein
MDLITGFPKVQGMDCIYGVVDRLNKYAHLFSIPFGYNASQVAYVFFRKLFKLHGLTRNIVTDRDSRFLNMFCLELLRLYRIELTPSTSYHP